MIKSIKLPTLIFTVLLAASCSNESSTRDEIKNNDAVIPENENINSVNAVEEKEEIQEAPAVYKLDSAPLSDYEDTNDQASNDIREAELMRIAQLPNEATDEDKLNAYLEYWQADEFDKRALAGKLLPIANAKIAELKETGYRFKVPVKDNKTYDRNGPNPYVHADAYILGDYDFDKKGFPISGCNMNSFTYSNKFDNTLYIKELEISKAAPDGTITVKDGRAVTGENYGDNCYVFVEDQKLAQTITNSKQTQSRISGYVYFDVPFREGEPDLLVQPIQADIIYTWSNSPELENSIPPKAFTWTY